MKKIEKISTGMPGLDEMLHGGLLPNRPYIVSGRPGTGKTTLCMQFLLDGLRQGENVLFVTLEIPPNEIKENVKSFGWDISEVKILDATSDIRRVEPTPIVEVASDKKVQKMKDISETIRKTPEYESFVVSIHSLQQMIRNETIKLRYDRIVIDSITGLKFFCMEGIDISTGIQSFIRFLSELRSTVLLVVETPELVKLEPEMFLARGEIRLQKGFENFRLKRCISIESYKGSRHDENLREFEITDAGLVVYSERNKYIETERKEAKEGSQDIKTKVPTKLGVEEALTYRQKQLLDEIIDIVVHLGMTLSESALPQSETNEIRALMTEIKNYIDKRDFRKALELARQCEHTLQFYIAQYPQVGTEVSPEEGTKELVFEEKVESVMSVEAAPTQSEEEIEIAQEQAQPIEEEKKWLFFRKRKKDKGKKKKFKLFS